MKPFLTALLLLSACASTGTPELTFKIERHDGSSSFNSSASQFEEDDYGESEGFSHDVSFSQDAYMVYGVALMIPLGAPVLPSAWRSGLVPPPPPPPPPGGPDEAPETPWYKDVMQWTLDVPPLILAMVLVALIVLGWLYREPIRKRIQRLTGKDTSDAEPHSQGAGEAEKASETEDQPAS